MGMEIVRRIDDLGRVVIPKNIRKDMYVREGDLLEIHQLGECVILRKYQEDSADTRQSQNKKKLLEYLENEIRLYKELGKDFEERCLELVAMQEKLMSGEFDC